MEKPKARLHRLLRLEVCPEQGGARQQHGQEEVKRVRAAIGSLAWCAKEGRPDASAGANVTKEGAIAQDKYTALEVAIVRERADGLGVQVRWVEHQSLVVDALAKVHGNPTPLYKLLDSGYYRIVAEAGLLDERAVLRAEGRVKRR